MTCRGKRYGKNCIRILFYFLTTEIQQQFQVTCKVILQSQQKMDILYILGLNEHTLFSLVKSTTVVFN